MEANVKDYSKYNNIRLSELENFFSTNALNMLYEYHVFTLEDLFKRFESEEFLRLFEETRTKSNARLHNEIFGTTKILRCKYLNEDPKINFDNFKDSFGFSSRIVHALSLYSNDDISSNLLFNMARENNFSNLIRRRNIGVAAIEEIRNKVTIVYNYYVQKKKEKGVAILIAELQDLLVELKGKVQEEQYNWIVENILVSEDIDAGKVMDVIEKVSQKIIEYK